MAYEIFISRGVASIPNAPQSIANAPLKPSVLNTTSAARRMLHFTSPATTRQPCCEVQATRARLGHVSVACDVPTSDQPYPPKDLSGTNVSRPLKEGHALQGHDQASAGAKSTCENSDMTSYGRTSEDLDPPSTFSKLRSDQQVTVDQPSRHANNTFSLQQSVPLWISLPTSGCSNNANPGSPVSSLPKPYLSTPPPISSEGSAKGSINEAYRHRNTSTVTFIDGHLDAFRLGGEPPSAPKRTLSEPEATQQNHPTGLKVQFTLPSHAVKVSMASGCLGSNDPVTTTFLDPFNGGLSELNRQPSDISELSGYVRPHAFSRHRDTLARITWTHEKNEEADDEGFESDEEYYEKATDVVNSRHAVKESTSILDFPAEILHEIFLLLQPCDFESARHACRSWFVVSLDRKVMGIMMRKAGCYSAFLADLSYRNEIQYTRGKQDTPTTEHEGGENAVLEYRNPEDGLFSEHWLASKRLATESRLSAAWHGSSLHDEAGHTVSRLAVRETVNFQRILSIDKRQGKGYGNTFTVSTCGRFLLAVSGQDVFVYDISSSAQPLQPAVRLTAESNILEVSMDTSSRRFAVAALLEGRNGACWEFDDIILNSAVEQLENFKSIALPSISHDLSGLPTDVPMHRDEITIIAEGEEQQSSHILQDQHLMAEPQWSFSSESTTRTSSSLSLESTIHKVLPLANSLRPSSVYHNLGTPGDPPRSVAICPQRKCAAFGCRAGIELHWVDAMNGNNLSRWFPLAAPSDHLYFLPQKSGADNGKKLRLISSAAGPLERPKKYDTELPTTSALPTVAHGLGRTRSMERLFSSNFLLSPGALARNSTSFEASNSNGRATTTNVNCDHYRAIPLSDGQHMLFTDPTTGLLCLGSDAPLGGPTKLVRKACMVPPSNDNACSNPTPVCYSAGFDLRWGVRIVAAYDDGRIVLYNIPSDCFARLRYIRSSPDVWDEFNGFIGTSDLMTDGFMLNQETAMNSTEAGEIRFFKPLQIDGALLGYVDADVESVAVDCTSGGLKAWVFHASGQATQMDVCVPKEHKIQSRFVGADGVVRNVPQTPSPGPIIKHFPTPQIGQAGDADDYFGSHVRFVGLDGCCDNISPMCGPMVCKHEIDYSDMHRDEGISMTPGASDDEDDNRPLQVELLTDWRTESLLRPYIVNVAWIDAH